MRFGGDAVALGFGVIEDGCALGALCARGRNVVVAAATRIASGLIVSVGLGWVGVLVLHPLNRFLSKQ